MPLEAAAEMGEAEKRRAGRGTSRISCELSVEGLDISKADGYGPRGNEEPSSGAGLALEFEIDNNGVAASYAEANIEIEDEDRDLDRFQFRIAECISQGDVVYSFGWWPAHGLSHSPRQSASEAAYRSSMMGAVDNNEAGSKLCLEHYENNVLPKALGRLRLAEKKSEEPEAPQTKKPSKGKGKGKGKGKKCKTLQHTIQHSHRHANSARTSHGITTRHMDDYKDEDGDDKEGDSNDCDADTDDDYVPHPDRPDRDPDGHHGPPSPSRAGFSESSLAQRRRHLMHLYYPPTPKTRSHELVLAFPSIIAVSGPLSPNKLRLHT
ncbi:hypothetical protein F5Y13DRAFT_193343 [Hypoxylon sp. FL1857]|nr:hypothetical protein F5Y13DRAFT_193343 [Hypoxylon sp. FL1857]